MRPDRHYISQDQVGPSKTVSGLGLVGPTLLEPGLKNLTHRPSPLSSHEILGKKFGIQFPKNPEKHAENIENSRKMYTGATE